MATRFLIAAVFLSTLFPLFASAEDGSCFKEAFRVCWREMPNRHEVFLCLLDKRRSLNEPCRSTMMREANARMHNGVMDRSAHKRD